MQYFYAFTDSWTHVTAAEFCKDKFKICLTVLCEKADSLFLFHNYVLTRLLLVVASDSTC